MTTLNNFNYNRYFILYHPHKKGETSVNLVIVDIIYFYGILFLCQKYIKQWSNLSLKKEYRYYMLIIYL